MAVWAFILGPPGDKDIPALSMSGETPNRLISALNPLEIGSTVHYAGHDWTVTGERSGKEWPAELLDYVLLVRDQHTDSFSGEPCFTSMGVRLADLAHLTGLGNRCQVVGGGLGIPYGPTSADGP